MKTLHQSPTDPDFVQNPYAFYNAARAGGPLQYWADYNMVAAFSHETVQTLLKDRRFGREIPTELASPDPDHLAPFYKVEATSMLADDLNASGALAAVFVFVKQVNVAIEEGGLRSGDKDRVTAALAGVDQVLGVLDPTDWVEEAAEGSDEDAEIDDLVAHRQAAREGRDFAEADRLRDELTTRGIAVEDTPQGPRWKRT